MKRFGLFLLGLLLVCLVLWQADFYQVLETVQDFSLTFLILTCSLQLVTILMINFQWQRLAAYMGQPVPLKKMLHINLVGTFVESITPSNKAGGELTKVFLLRSKLDFSTSRATALAFVQKTISIIVFITLNLAAILWFLLTVESQGLYFQVLATAFLGSVLILTLVSLFVLWPEKFYSFLAKIPLSERTKEKIESTILLIRNNLKRVVADRALFKEQLLLSLAIWLLFPIKAYLIIIGLGLKLSFIEIGVVTYLTYLVGMLPLLPGGIGTVESSTMFFLLPLGVAAADGLAVALILRFVTFWFVFLFSASYMGYHELGKLIKNFSLV